MISPVCSDAEWKKLDLDVNPEALIIDEYKRLREIKEQKLVKDKSTEKTVLANVESERKHFKDMAYIQSERKHFKDMAHIQNLKWEQDYFKFTAEEQDSKDHKEKYHMLKERTIQLDKLISRTEDDMANIEPIYRSSLTVIPEAHLLLSWNEDENSSKSQIKAYDDLYTDTKQFAAENLSPAFISNTTLISKYQILRDVSKYTVSSNVETFESDPERHMKRLLQGSRRYYILQKFLIHPEFKESEFKELPISNGKSGKKEHSYSDGFEAVEIKSKSDIPEFCVEFIDDDEERSKTLETMLSEIDTFNKEQRKTLDGIEVDYNSRLRKNMKRRKEYEKERKEVYNDISTIYRYTNSTDETIENDLENRIEETGTVLKQHISERERILVTFQDEVEQKGTTLDDLFKKIITTAYKELIKRAEALLYHKVYYIDNGILVGTDGKSFYNDPIPTEFSLPTYLQVRESDELDRCGIVLGLKVKFNSKIPLSRKTVIIGQKPVNFIYIKNPNKERGFYMQETEATNEQWKSIMEADKNLHPDKHGDGQPVTDISWNDVQKRINILNSTRAAKAKRPYPAKHRDNLPVTKVSMNEIQEFINKLNRMGKKEFRLLTEVEREYAATAGPNDTKAGFLSVSREKTDMDNKANDAGFRLVLIH